MAKSVLAFMIYILNMVFEKDVFELTKTFFNLIKILHVYQNDVLVCSLF